MKKDTRGAAIIRAIAHGSTLKAAGEAIGLKSTRASQVLNKYCRQIGLPGVVADIKNNPSVYLEKIEITQEIDQSPLARNSINDLVYKLKLSSTEQLTPKYLSNVTATQLLAAGVTLVTISDLQDWLKNTGHSLKRHPPETNDATKAIKRAINLLDAFYFDVSSINEQFKHFTNANG